MKRVAVLGAAGFIGATFVEHLLARGGWEVRSCIHTSGGGWRLSRHGIDLPSVDVTDLDQVRAGVRGCSHIVNAVMGPRDAMIHGLDNVLRACREAGVERYVHVSSVSAYGDRVVGSVLQSSDAPSDSLTDYGKMKLEQDRKVEAACRGGLPSVTLAPPNISGAYSSFLTKVLQTMSEGRLALVDGGELPCSLVDVQNLSVALEQALDCDRADASRLLVTDGGAPCWRELAERLAPLAGCATPLPSVDRDEARRLTHSEAPRASLRRSLRSVASIVAAPRTRAILSRDPLIGRVYRGIAGVVPDGLKRRVRRMGGPPGTLPPLPQNGSAPAGPWDPHLLQVQLRAVRHSNDAATEVLGYRPALGFGRSMEVFERWYRTTHGHGDEAWEAFRAL